MNWEMVDPQIVQLYGQLLYLQKQLTMAPPEDIKVDKFVISLLEFINELGNELQRQAI